MKERRRQQGKRVRCCSPGKGGEGHTLNVQEEKEIVNRVKHPCFYYGSVRGPAYRDTCCGDATPKVRG